MPIASPHTDYGFHKWRNKHRADYHRYTVGIKPKRRYEYSEYQYHKLRTFERDSAPYALLRI